MPDNETPLPLSSPPAFRSGFVNIIGRPNAGKSTLMNALVGERMSIITHKPQTTRHRIIGILSGEDFQVVFSDTPGYVKQPQYRMHQSMNHFVEGTVEDADLMLFVFDLTEELEDDNPVIAVLKKTDAPILLVLNKKDLVAEQRLQDAGNWWRKRITFADTLGISSSRLSTQEAGSILEKIKSYLPESPPFYPADQLTDRPERFFVSEIIREKILLLYTDEIPYSCEVGIESYKETATNAGEPIARIHAIIYVMRESQKAILLGKGGSAIKKLGTYARAEIERFVQTKVYLELTVKVRDNWRDDERSLQMFGYGGGD
ncbi:MAG TPA: GTPase Era [Saprospiraceae bacterium]|nr:GTPase Era [Saprospiraceae bacterium]